MAQVLIGIRFSLVMFSFLKLRKTVSNKCENSRFRNLCQKTITVTNFYIFKRTRHEDTPTHPDIWSCHENLNLKKKVYGSFL